MSDRRPAKAWSRFPADLGRSRRRQTGTYPSHWFEADLFVESLAQDKRDSGGTSTREYRKGLS